MMSREVFEMSNRRVVPRHGVVWPNPVPQNVRTQVQTIPLHSSLNDLDQGFFLLAHVGLGAAPYLSAIHLHRKQLGSSCEYPHTGQVVDAGDSNVCH